MSSSGKRNIGRPQTDKPKASTLRSRKSRASNAANDKPTPRRSNRLMLQEEKAKSTTAYALNPTLPNAPREIFGPSSEDWLAEAQCPFTLAKANRLHKERIAIRYLQTAFVLGGNNAITPSLDTGVELISFHLTHGWRKWLQVRKSRVHLDKKEGKSPGLGVFAARHFKQDDVITQFVGSRTRSVSQKRKWLGQWKKDYIVTLPDESFVCPQSDDLEHIYFAGHKINHSSFPNAHIGTDLVIRALHDIKAGNEITFNYNRTSDIQI